METTYIILVVFFTTCTESREKCVDDHGSKCCANFKLTKDGCKPCEDGTFGVNCSESCPSDRYGEKCLAVCNCTEEEFCDGREGCVKQTTTGIRKDNAVGSTMHKSVHVTSNDFLSTTTLESDSPDLHRYAQTPVSPKGTGTRRSEDADTAISNIFIITGSCLLALCILSVIAYLCYSKRRKRHRRKSDRSGNRTAGDISQDAGLEDNQCIYNTVNSIYEHEPPLPCPPSADPQEPPLPCPPSADPDPLYGHTADATYNILTLKLKLDNKVLDPECDHLPKPPDSVTQVHDVYEEPIRFIPSDKHEESNSLVKTTVSGYTDNYVECVDIPGLKRDPNTSGISISGGSAETKPSKTEFSKTENADEEISLFVVKSSTENHSFHGSIEKDLSGVIADDYYIISKVEVDNRQSI